MRNRTSDANQSTHLMFLAHKPADALVDLRDLLYARLDQLLEAESFYQGYPPSSLDEQMTWLRGVLHTVEIS